MNDTLTLTLIPKDGGIAIPWRTLSVLLEGFERLAKSLASKIDELTIDDVEIILIGAPTAGSVRFNFELKVSATFKPRKTLTRRRQLDANELEQRHYRSLLEQVGVNALGGILAGVILTVGGSASLDPRFGDEAALTDICAKKLHDSAQRTLKELALLAAHSGCQSATLGYESFEPLELVGKSRSLRIRNEEKGALPDRLRLNIVDRRPVRLYFRGVERRGYLAKRDDTSALSLVLFPSPIPTSHIFDKYEVKARRLSAADKKEIYIHPSNSDLFRNDKFLSDVRSVLAIDEIVLPVALAQRSPG